MEGEPGVHTLTQCTLLLVMRDVWKVSCCTHAYTVYTPIGDEGCSEGEPAVHTCTVYTLLVMRDVRKVSLLYTRLYSVDSYW